MVTVEETAFLSDIRDQTNYRPFPDEMFETVVSAVESVPPAVFEDAERGSELRRFDSAIAEHLPEFEHEHGGEGHRNAACKLWANEGFGHSVDLYHPEQRIAIEVEKSEAKRLSDDILKFIKGGKTQRANRKKIEFGCLVVPVNYLGARNLLRRSIRDLKFMRSVLFVEDIAVLGYTDPRWEA